MPECMCPRSCMCVFSCTLVCAHPLITFFFMCARTCLGVQRQVHHECKWPACMLWRACVHECACVLVGVCTLLCTWMCVWPCVHKPLSQTCHACLTQLLSPLDVVDHALLRSLFPGNAPCRSSCLITLSLCPSSLLPLGQGLPAGSVNERTGSGLD